MRKILVALAVLITLSAGVGAFLQYERRSHAEDERALATRRRDIQQAALRGYLARSDGRRLLPQNAVTIAVRRDLLQSALQASLPFQHGFEDGKYVARLDSAHVNLSDGLAAVELTGVGSLASDPTIAARLQVEGSLGIARLDAASGQLVPELVITDVRVIRAGPVALEPVTNPAVRFFSRQKAREWSDLAAPIHLPLRLESTLKVPRVEGDISFPEKALPIALRVAAVTTFRNLLVVSLELLSDSTAGGVVANSPGRPPERGDPLGQDSSKGAGLHEIVQAAAARDTLWQAIEGADRDVVVVMPRDVLSELANRAARRFRNGAQVDFRPEIAESLDKALSVNVLGQKVGAGHIRVDIRVRHLRGRLATHGAAALALHPPDALALDLPIGVEGGAGNASFDVKWEPAALVSVVCKAFESHLDLSGVIAPTIHPVHETTLFHLEGNHIVGRPVVRRDRVPMAFDLDPGSWDKVRAVLVEQDRFSRCSVGIDPDAIIGQLRQFGAEGLKVRLPANLLPSFSLPVEFEDAYVEGDVRVAVAAHDPSLVVREDYLRFGVDAELKVTRLPKP